MYTIRLLQITLYSASCCYVPIYCKRSLDKNERNIEKKRGSRTSIHRRLIPLPLLSPHLTARETQKKNGQKPATALGRQASRKEKYEYGRISVIIETEIVLVI